MMELSDIDGCDDLQSIIRDYNQCLKKIFEKYIEKSDSGIELKIDSTNRRKALTVSELREQIYNHLESIVSKFLVEDYMKIHGKWFCDNEDSICEGYDLVSVLAVQMTEDPNYHIHLGEVKHKELLHLPRNIIGTKELISVKVNNASSFVYSSAQINIDSSYPSSDDESIEVEREHSVPVSNFFKGTPETPKKEIKLANPDVNPEEQKKSEKVSSLCPKCPCDII